MLIRTMKLHSIDWEMVLAIVVLAIAINSVFIVGTVCVVKGYEYCKTKELEAQDTKILLEHIALEEKIILEYKNNQDIKEMKEAKEDLEHQKDMVIYDTKLHTLANKNICPIGSYVEYKIADKVTIPLKVTRIDIGLCFTDKGITFDALERDTWEFTSWKDYDLFSSHYDYTKCIENHRKTNEWDTKLIVEKEN